MQTSQTTEVMTRKLFSIPAATSLHDAYELMKEKRIHQIPVVDKKDHVIGVLEEKNLDALDIDDIFRVEDFVSPTHSVTEDTPLRSVVLFMLERKLSYVLISSEKGDVIGIVTTDDLLWYLAHLLNDKPNNKSNRKSFLNADQIQTIGEISRELAEMGI